MQALTKKVQAVPQGYSSVTPYLIVDGATKLIEFIKQTFDAQERERVPGSGGKISHAELKIGDSIIMLADSTMEWKPMPVNLYVYVDDMDTVYRKALAAGAVTIREPKDQLYGDRSASVKDPLGNVWGIATHIEDVSPDEMQRRMKEESGNQ